MKKLIWGLCLPFLFAACSSDNVDLFDENENSLFPSTPLCCQAEMGAIDMGNESNGTLGRAGQIEISRAYPGDKIYLITNVRKYMAEYSEGLSLIETTDKYLDRDKDYDEDDYDDKYKLDDLIDDYEDDYILEIPVKKSGDRRYIDICFSHTDPDDDDDDDIVKPDELFAISGDEEVKFNLYEDCIFSSVPSGVALMKKKYLSEDDKIVYEPYGDQLFFSELFTVSANEKQYTLSFQNGGGRFTLSPDKNSRIPITMKRATAKLKSGLVITNTDKNKLSGEEFKKKLGDVKDWELSSVLGGSPQVCTVRNYINNSYPTHTFFVNLFDETKLTNTEHKDENGKHYQGFGYKDNHGSFIFRIASGQGSTYYNFKYNEKIATLHVKMDDIYNPIEWNSNWHIVTIIDYMDLYHAMFDDSFDNKNKSSRSSEVIVPYLPEFGKMIDIPYKNIIVKE